MIKLIGFGMYGLVISPSLDCDTGILKDENTIGKIGKFVNLFTEFDFYQSLEQFENQNLVSGVRVLESGL